MNGIVKQLLIVLPPLRVNNRVKFSGGSALSSSHSMLDERVRREQSAGTVSEGISTVTGR